MTLSTHSLAATLAAAAMAALPAGAVSLGQTDHFNGGLTAGWASGAANPNPPVGVASGGPGGAGDGYLHIPSNGAGGAGGRLVVFSGDAWAGNYSAAGISAITMDVNNLGLTDLSLRLYFENASAAAYSLQAISLPAGSGWTPVRFDIQPSALSGAAAAALASALDFRLYHSPAAGAPQAAPFIAASLGIDRVSAVPEPAAAGLMALGLGLGLAAHRAGPRRQRRR